MKKWILKRKTAALTIQDASKLIVNKDGKVMQGEDIGHKTRENSLLQNAQATIYERAENCCNRRLPVFMGPTKS